MRNPWKTSHIMRTERGQRSTEGAAHRGGKVGWKKTSRLRATTLFPVEDPRISFGQTIVVGCIVHATDSFTNPVALRPAVAPPLDLFSPPRARVIHYIVRSLTELFIGKGEGRLLYPYLDHGGLPYIMSFFLVSRPLLLSLSLFKGLRALILEWLDASGLRVFDRLLLPRRFHS